MTLRLPALAGLLAAAAVLLAAAPASATIIYKARLTGTYEQDWKVHDPEEDCVAGAGAQVTRFATRGTVLLGGSTETEGYDPRANSIDMDFEPIAVRGTITRTDGIAPFVSSDCDGTEYTLPPHDCPAGPRAFSIAAAILHKGPGLHSAKLHLQLTGLDDGYRPGIAARRFKDTHACFAPDTAEEEGPLGMKVRWPTNTGIAKLHRTFVFSGSEPIRPERDDPMYTPEGPELSFDVSETLKWKLTLRSKCYRDPTRKGLRCS